MTEVIITIEDVLAKPNGVVKIAHIVGQLDESNVDQKIQEIYKIIETNQHNLYLILDLSGLEYMNSKSIGYFTDIYGKVSEGGGKLIIAQPRPNILDILQVVGLTQLLEKYDTVEIAKNIAEQNLNQVQPTQAIPEIPQPVAPNTSLTSPTPEPATTPIITSTQNTNVQPSSSQIAAQPQSQPVVQPPVQPPTIVSTQIVTPAVSQQAPSSFVQTPSIAVTPVSEPQETPATNLATTPPAPQSQITATPPAAPIQQVPPPQPTSVAQPPGTANPGEGTYTFG